MKYREKIKQFKTFVVKHGNWKEDAWGNLVTVRDGKQVRIHFKQRVARMEVKSASGIWNRLYSAPLKNLEALIVEGKLKIKGFKRG
jgi:hypothetical protein